jgi:hypothetical protein
MATMMAFTKTSTKQELTASSLCHRCRKLTGEPVSIEVQVGCEQRLLYLPSVMH